MKFSLKTPSDVIVEKTTFVVPNHLFCEPNKSAIYGILNLVNGKIYIGSAVDSYHRLRTHKSKLKYNQHGNKHLQAAWNEYSELAFEFVILEYVADKKDLLSREQVWIDLTDCHNPECGYNFRKVAHSNLGLKKKFISEETRHKLRLANTGRKHTEESKLKLSKASKANAVEGRAGYIHSEKTKIKMSISQSAKSTWLHADKSACKCRECKDRRNLNDRLNKYNHKGKYSL